MKDIKMKEKDSICKLCMKNDKLCDSHIVPEFVYYHIYERNRKKKHLWIKDKDNPQIPKNTYRQKGYTENLMCINCENIFSQFENYFKQNFKNLNESEQKFEFLDIDYFQIRKFILSILWRCAITDIEHLKIDLGDTHIENLRKILNNDTSDPNNQYHIVLHYLYDEEKKMTTDDLKGFMIVGEALRLEGFRLYNFCMFGLMISCLVGSSNHKLSDYLKYAVCKDKYIPIIKSDIRKNEFIKSNFI